MKPQTPFARLDRAALPAAMQPAWDTAMARHGDATFVEVLGQAPEMYAWYYHDFYEKVFRSGRIDRRVAELVRLRLANIHGCAFCNRNDRIAALEAGLTEAEIEALPAYETGPFTDAEKAALALADVMALTNPKGAVTPALHARLRAHFTDGQLVELGMVMAVLCGMAKFIFAYDLVEKEEYCPFLPVQAA